MISVSDRYKELMMSHIRPKCEPVIKLSGIDKTGKQIEKIWQAKNIKDLKYKRGIDPAGRSLPFMELTWTEVYTGKLNYESYPIIYENIAQYMAVDLSFIQSLGFYNTWKILYESGVTFKTLFDNSTTWGQLKKSVTVEEIKLPRLFLEARPTINGNTITWIARDLLYFLNDTQIKAFRPNDTNTGLGGSMAYINPLLYLLVNARGSFKNNEGIFKATHRTIERLQENTELSAHLLDKDIIIDGITKDNIRNYANLVSHYWDYSGDNINLGSADLKHFSFNNYETVHHFTKRTMYSYPKITNGADIGGYSFKHYTTETDTETYYEREPSSHIEIQGQKLYRWNYDKYGSIKWETTSNGGFYDEINYALGWSSKKLQIHPVNHNSFDNYLLDGEGTVGDAYIGEDFVEDNPINPYDKNSSFMKSRLDVLRKYFNSYHSAVEFETLANPSVETGDVIKIDTNLYNNDGSVIQKNAVIVELELSYNGALKERIIAHEVSQYV